jgi:hypothetical protein
MGLRPIRPSITGQREPADDRGPGPVSAHWGSPDELPPVVGWPGGGAPVTASAPVQLSPLAAPSAGPGGSPDRSTGAMVDLGSVREITFPPRDAGVDATVAPVAATGATGPVGLPVQRHVEPAMTHPRAGSAGPAGSRPAAARPSAGDPHRPLTLARAAAPGSAGVSSAPAAGGGGSQVVARIVADPARPSAPTVVQAERSSTTGGTPVGTITATPIVQRVDGAAPPAETGTDGHSDRELDDLARALFGRIRGHLRAEVIHEREAKGLTFDAF